MKFYIASSFKNIDTVRYVSEKLIRKGFIHTYDWTQNERDLTIEQLREMVKKRKPLLLKLILLFVLLPAGKGSHIELGIAIGQGKRTYLYSPNNEVNNLATTSTFYHLPEVEKCIGSIDELVDIVAS